MALRGTIVFSSGESGEYDVWTRSLSTGNLLRITDSEGSSDQACWSPSGKEIAFSCARNAATQIWVCSSDGSGKRQLTFGDKHFTSPIWMPEGDRILCQGRQRLSDPLVELWSFPLGAGEEPELLFEEEGVQDGMSLSPKGSLLFFSAGKAGATDIVQRSLKTGKQRQLTSHVAADLSPSISPDGSTVAFVSNRDPSGSGTLDNFDIWIMKRDGLDEPRRLTTNRVADQFVSWSPDGRYLLYCASRQKQAEHGSIQVIDLKGEAASGPVELSELIESQDDSSSPDFQGGARHPRLK